MADRRQHWDDVYRLRGSVGVSWFQPRAEPSLRLIRQAGLAPSAALIDVGGGASLLVDALLQAGFVDLSVLDLSAQALAQAQDRLGAAAAAVRWFEADVTTADLPAGGFDLWHDRAVFHFLTTPPERAGYLRTLRGALRPGGWLLVATFAPDGPSTCSDLPVARYDGAGLAAAFGADFVLQHSERQVHCTPGGVQQPFTWCLLRHMPRA